MRKFRLSQETVQLHLNVKVSMMRRCTIATPTKLLEKKKSEKDKRQKVKPNNNEMPNCQLEALRRDPTTRTKENQEKARVTSIKCVTDKCKGVLYQKEKKNKILALITCENQKKQRKEFATT